MRSPGWMPQTMLIDLCGASLPARLLPLDREPGEVASLRSGPLNACRNRVYLNFSSRSRSRQPASPELIILCRTFDQIEVALEEGIETIYVDFEDVRLYQQAVDRIGDRAHAFLATPRIQKSGEQGFFRLIENARPYGVLIRNLGSISFFRRKGFRLHGDFSLNVANPLTADFFADSEALIS